MEIFNPENYETNESSWWFVFDPETLLLLSTPQQCSGKTSSINALVVFDTLQECEDYISTNNLKYPEETELPEPEPTNQE